MREFYREQVGIDIEPGLTVSRRSPMEGALRDTGATMSKISTDYIKRMAREEAEASVAAEDVRQKRSWLEAEVQMSQMQDPKEIVSFYEEWEQNEREVIGEIDTNRLGKRAISMRSEKVLGDTRIKALGLGGFADQAQINKNAMHWWGVVENAEMDIYPDGFGSAENAHDTGLEKLLNMGRISPKQYAARQAGFETTRSYNAVAGDLAGMDEAYRRGELPSQTYIQNLELMRGEVSEMKLEAGQRGQIDRTISSRLGYLVGQQVKAQGQALDNMKLKIREKDFDLKDQALLTQTFGEPYSELVSQAQEESLRGLAATDENAAKLVDILDRAIMTETGKTEAGKTAISWQEAVRELHALDASGSLKYVAGMVLADNYMEMAETHGYITAHEAWTKKDIWIPSNGTVQKVVRGVAFYSEQTGVDQTFIKSAFDAATKWKETGKYDGKEVSEDEMLRGLFKDQAMKFIMQQSAPQMKSSPASEIPVGFEDDGYRFMGGDPKDESNWELIK